MRACELGVASGKQYIDDIISRGHTSIDEYEALNLAKQIRDNQTSSLYKPNHTHSAEQARMIEQIAASRRQLF